MKTTIAAAAAKAIILEWHLGLHFSAPHEATAKIK